jgi:hypothetical protein
LNPDNLIEFRRTLSTVPVNAGGESALAKGAYHIISSLADSIFGQGFTGVTEMPAV